MVTHIFVTVVKLFVTFIIIHLSFFTIIMIIGHLGVIFSVFFALQPEEIEKFIRGACKPTNTLFISNIHDSIEGKRKRTLQKKLYSRQ